MFRFLKRELDRWTTLLGLISGICGALIANEVRPLKVMALLVALRQRLDLPLLSDRLMNTLPHTRLKSVKLKTIN